LKEKTQAFVELAIGDWCKQKIGCHRFLEKKSTWQIMSSKNRDFGFIANLFILSD
jgi:hypothetical protein